MPTKIPPEVWKKRKFDNIPLQLCNVGYMQNNNIGMDKMLYPPLSQERWPHNH